MTRFLFLIGFHFATLNGLSQVNEEFKQEFKKSTGQNFSSEDLNNLFKRYSSLLTPHSDVTNLAANLKGEIIVPYPLAEFKSDKLYVDHITQLMKSKNSNKRLLAYLVIAATGDTSREKDLLFSLRHEKNKAALAWAAMALMHLNTSNTTELFDYLVENENFGDAHMLPLLFKLNKDSLKQTAYRRINSESLKARILSVQLLSKTDLNPQTESILRDAVKKWDIDVKGYALFTIKELQMGNLLEMLKPLLNDRKTKRIAYEALANSPTKEDRDYLVSLSQSDETFSRELFEALFNSKNIESLKYWLELAGDRPIQMDFYISVQQQPLIFSDAVLPLVHSVLQKSSNTEVVNELVRALAGRTDDKTTDILLNLLRHRDSSIRYWTVTALKGNHSPRLVRELPKLIRDTDIENPSLTSLLIENNIDSLQAFYQNILETSSNTEWRRSSLEYLSSFPLPKYAVIFKAILENHTSGNFYESRLAASGLGRLKDESAVELIISVCREESISSDSNAIPYLHALAMTKSEKAKKEILRYKDSKEQIVIKIVSDILNNW